MSKKWIAVGFAILALLTMVGCGRIANPAGALFNNANWRALDKAPDQHKGASVDVVGQVDLQASRDSEGILNWGIRIGLGDGHGVYAFCNTTSSLDESLLASKNWIRVRGTVMGGAPTSDWTHILIFAQTIEQAQSQWVTVATLNGNGNKRGKAFTLSGTQARLTYTVSGDMPTLLVYLIARGESLGASAGLPEVSVDRAGSGSAMVANTGGDYYLDVSSFGCTWRLTVEEQR